MTIWRTLAFAALALAASLAVPTASAGPYGRGGGFYRPYYGGPRGGFYRPYYGYGSGYGNGFYGAPALSIVVVPRPVVVESPPPVYVVPSPGYAAPQPGAYAAPQPSGPPLGEPPPVP